MSSCRYFVMSKTFTQEMTKVVPKGFWQKRTDKLAENAEIFAYVKKKLYLCGRKGLRHEKKYFSYYGSNDFAGNRLFEETGTAGK